ncbi:hypothetical protein Kpol_1074p4 [Vanderwaltozyma polyspora DSM 70294]|uniref:Uncharacterized protein n=1 Tax=Vanderwaltozyma polyspora (strain ATCC 22028 / DSM 70294 / BCRC 21397 / CBS 2163 / NBRC 10782 / NRRL Y-8283 / UCD 57-17) TaxID=436907 RepID=A7TTQ8_VANPO|nr:uncharacterized protein Kpol_1074p4 [Vanderwaltozyma polyspora DSM 70294]EDO14351.1 hypothetical protein Kpol_1074p4 [Vanderwaltozyma polyspora DSM 70294]
MSGRVFQSNLMFTKRSHSNIKRLNVKLSLKDLMAPTVGGFIAYLSWGVIKPRRTESEKGNNSMVAILGLGEYSLSQYWINPSLLFTSRIPTLFAYSFGTMKVMGSLVVQGFQFFSWRSIRSITGPLLLTTAVLGVAYLVHDLPNALPKNLLEKYKNQLEKVDYINTNAERIVKEVREVLKIPVREILKTSELILDKKQSIKKQLEKKYEDIRISSRIFQQISEKTASQKMVIDALSLDID